MTARLHFVVEGQTEETFVNLVLRPHLGLREVWADARSVMTRRKHGIITHRGGLRSYARAKRDLTLWMKEDGNADAFFTTMFDLYALPNDFPGYGEAWAIRDAYQRVKALEQALQADLGHWRFLPYLQLHEFEALLLSDPEKLNPRCPERGPEIQNLIDLVAGFDSPELIDEGAETAPSRRIIKEIPEYEGMKVSAGPLVAEHIGLPTLRARCRHFHEWLNKLESLPQLT